MAPNRNEQSHGFLPTTTSVSTIPNPPLPFWPRPPSLCEGQFSEHLSQASLMLFCQVNRGEQQRKHALQDEEQNALPDLETLVHRRACLVNLRQELNNHFEEVATWAQQCHAQQSSQLTHHHHTSFDLLGSTTTSFQNAPEWVDFIKGIQVYLKDHVISRYQFIETEIHAITQQVSEMQDSMAARLVQLEEEVAMLQAKRKSLHDATR